MFCCIRLAIVMGPPVPMNLRDIRLFVAVYEERSFTAAAARENATQSGVSQRIRLMEEGFGVRLFSRGGAAVVPTPAGDGYYTRCVEVLRAHEAANRAVLRYRTGIDGEIVVGLMPTMTRCALAPALARFIEEHPNVAVRIVEAYSGVLTDQVRAGELSFAVVPAIQGAVGLRSRLFLRTPELLVSRRGSPLRHLEPVRIADLGPLRLVVPGARNTRRRRIETYLASNGAKVERLLELDAMFATLDFVASTGWVTILPGAMMVPDIERRQVTVNPIADPPFATDLVLIEPLRQPMSAAAEAFLDILGSETARLNERWSAFVPQTSYSVEPFEAPPA
jgi:LysR family transcriptional regulator, nitrogen assimilation regulatory protein